ncbi:MAG: carbohydrate kinase family protein [Candidatus Gastranaerophilales bacterium]|nr:carbohydrate kinase family protein [Candidatus Gastranaerophilales bacterium]
MFDVVTFGSATIDIFVESDEAHVVNIRGVEGEIDLYCLKYGEKIEIDHSAFEAGGGAINTAACLAKLGYKTAAAIKVGEGVDRKDAKKTLKKYDIDGSFVMHTDEVRTGFSIILTSFEGDRTVLAHRGANITLKKEDIDFERLKQTKWIYCAPLNSIHGCILEDITDFADDNDIKVFCNLGGRALERSLEELSKILKHVNIVSLNTQEATRITGIEQKYCKKKKLINDDVKEMMKKFKKYVKDLVIITDGAKGAYAYDGDKFYYAPIFPTKRVSSLGAGDAFASTFCGAYMKKEDIKTCLELASINSGHVVTCYNAQDGLQNYDKLLEIRKENPDFKAIEVDD